MYTGLYIWQLVSRIKNGELELVVTPQSRQVFTV